jgi:nucleoside-diphosphate-sugar epimerase
LEVFGDGGQVRDFTYVDDVVAATVRAVFADLPSNLVLDIASGRPTSVATLIEELRAIAGTGDPVLEHQQQRPGDVSRTEGRIDGARTYLDWSPTTGLGDGLRRQVAWQTELRRGRRPAPQPIGHRS